MNINQQAVESRSVWEAHDIMPTVSEITSPSIHASQIYPQYPPDNRALQPYRQAWILENHPDNETKNTKDTTCTPERKKILSLLGIGTLIGLFVCGIPLAVMTTLYLQERSQTTSNTNSSGSGSGSGSNGTNTATTSTLPSQCTSYISNTDYSRNVAYGGCCWCDSGLTAGWYRFSGSAGTQLATSPVNINLCGNSYPGWFNGTLPTTTGATTNGIVCVNQNGYVCYIPYSVTTVLATNCGSYYVFFLTPMSTCLSRYCTM